MVGAARRRRRTGPAGARAVREHAGFDGGLRAAARAGLRACADLAEQARACRDDLAARAADPPHANWPAWSRGCSGSRSPTIPTSRRNTGGPRHLGRRVDQAGRGQRPRRVARRRQGRESLGCPHRAGYAFWRQAEAQLDAGQPVTAAAAALRAAAAAADRHAPLLAQVRALAQRARIPFQAPPAAL